MYVLLTGGVHALRWAAKALLYQRDSRSQVTVVRLPTSIPSHRPRGCAADVGHAASLPFSTTSRTTRAVRVAQHIV